VYGHIGKRMARSPAEVEAICAELLAGLNEDALSYICEGVIDDGTLLSREDLVDFVSPHLLEICDGDEDKAAALAGVLHERLSPSDPKPKAAAPKKATGAAPKAMALGEMLGTSKPAEEPAPEVPVATAKAASASKKGSAASAKASKGASKKAEQVAAHAAELEAELEAAREAAIKLRATKGSYQGSMEIGPLTLPNPGGGLDLLEDASFTLTPGRRYALIGRNGKGKSTLLRYLASRRVGGLPANIAVHYVSQDVSFSSAALASSPAEVVLEADVERRMLLKEVAALEGKETAEDQARLQSCMSQLEAIDADTAPERATQLLVNLGFSEELRSRKLQALSGGWRVRVALAAALFAKPDLLLLDEPTNHLSIQAVMWLSNELATNAIWQSRTVVIVSHDRMFIDECCTDTLHISGVARRLTQSKGNYSMWAKRRAEQQKARERQLEVEAAEKDKLSEYVGHGFKYGGSSGQITMQQKMKKQIEKMETRQEAEAEELAALQEDADLPLTMHAGGVLDTAAVQLQGVAFAYPSAKPLFKGAEFTVDGRSRIVLVGENGNGKTTLVKLILGELEPTGGKIVRNRGARVALVNQHHADQLDLSMTPLQFMLNKFPGDGSYAQEQALRSHLSQCGCDAQLQGVPASALSGGQRSRVAMAAVSFEKPHILVMDEPTNNLDLGSIEALADTVEKFEGGVVLVSHDQYFVSRVAKEVWIVADGSVKRAESFDSYRAKLKSVIKR